MTRVEPSTVSLLAGESTVVEVDLFVPDSTPSDAQLTLTTTASKSDDDSVFNSAILELRVIRNHPPDISLVAGANVVLWPPNRRFVPVDIKSSGQITDPDGDEVTIVVNSITQDEPVDADGRTAPDAIDLGNGVVSLRAERSGKGNGRVYSIAFTGTDSHELLAREFCG